MFMFSLVPIELDRHTILRHILKQKYLLHNSIEFDIYKMLFVPIHTPHAQLNDLC